MNYFENNIKKLKETNIDIFDYINKEKVFDEENQENGEQRLICMPSKLDDGLSYKINKDGEIYNITSEYMPNTMAEVFCDTINAPQYGYVLIIFGIGSMTYINKMLTKFEENIQYIIYEPDKEVFLESLKFCDYSLLSNKTHLVIKGINDNMFDFYFNNVIKEYNKDVTRYIPLPNYKNMYAKEFNDLLDIISTALLVKYADRNIYRESEKNIMKNIMGMLDHLKDASLMDQIENSCGRDYDENIPAIIVSAGPSLNKNIMQLKNAKGKAFIIAVDTALKPLLNSGIIPDICVTIDHRKPLSRFENLGAENIPMLVSEHANIQILDKIIKKKIFINNGGGCGEMIFSRLNKIYKIHDGGGSVATYAFTAAILMGFKKIILTGQDLAYTGGIRYYDKNMKEGLDPNNEEDRDSFVEIESNDGKKVMTTVEFKMYIEWFEKRIAENPDIKVYNCSEGGALIKGCINEKLDNVIQNECREEFDFSTYIKNIPPILNEDEKKEYEKIVSELFNNIKRVGELAKDGLSLYEEINKEADKENINMKKVKELLMQASDTVSTLENMYEYELISILVKSEAYDISEGIYTTQNDVKSEIKILSQKGIAMMKNTLVGVEGTLDMYNERVKKGI